jgi:hypothetical protein
VQTGFQAQIFNMKGRSRSSCRGPGRQPHAKSGVAFFGRSRSPWQEAFTNCHESVTSAAHRQATPRRRSDRKQNWGLPFSPLACSIGRRLEIWSATWNGRSLISRMD